MKRFSLFLMGLVFSTISTISTISYAAELTPYTKSSFEKTLKEGKPAVIQFHADWCPSCRKQEASLKEINLVEISPDLIIYKADYDAEKELKKTYKVSSQSTIIIFNKGQEVSRFSGKTSKVELNDLIKSNLGK